MVPTSSSHAPPARKQAMDRGCCSPRSTSQAAVNAPGAPAGAASWYCSRVTLLRTHWPTASITGPACCDRSKVSKVSSIIQPDGMNNRLRKGTTMFQGL